MEKQSLHFVAIQLTSQSSAGAELGNKLNDVAKTLKSSHYEWPTAFKKAGLCSAIVDVAVGPSHCAFLFDDGSVARLRLSIHPERLELHKSKGDVAVASRSAQQQNKSRCVVGGAVGGGGGGTVVGVAVGGSALRAPQQQQSATAVAGGAALLDSSSVASRTAKIRRVMMAARSGRAGRGVIVGSRPLIPASEVPEHLVAQAQVVLQGKSREVIVRELQRTNLNVNEAVNNLLSREDDEEDMDDSAGDAYLPEELISLLGESGVILDGAEGLYASEVFDYAMARDAAKRRLEKEQKLDRLRGSTVSTQQSSHNAAQLAGIVSPDETLTFWLNETGEKLRFRKVAALYSEMLAVSADGFRLYGWRWDDEFAPHHTHIKRKKLGLDQLEHEHERIEHLAVSTSRCTIATSRRRVCSFVDWALGRKIGDALDVPLTELVHQSPNSTILSVHACPLYSMVRLSNSTAFWWGFYPSNERQKRWDRSKQKSKKRIRADKTLLNVGDDVQLRSNPIYPIGSVGFITVNGYPQVGELMEAAWTLTERCRFRLRTDQQIENEWRGEQTVVVEGDAKTNESDQSLAGSTIAADLLGNRKRRLGPEKCGPREEPWDLKDVAFVEPLVSTGASPTGKVIKVDGNLCCVVFPHSDGTLPDSPEQQYLEARLYKKDDLVVVDPLNPIRPPETVQVEPKKLALPHDGSICDMTLESTGIRLLMEREGRMRLVRSTLSGRQASDRQLAVLPTSALGVTASCDNYGDDVLYMLRDGNGCFTPLRRDAVREFHEPPYMGLPVFDCVANGIHPLKAFASSSAHCCNRLGLSAFVMRRNRLLDHVQHCDLDGVKAFLAHLEIDANLDKAQQEVANCRMDGNRNVLHAVVMNCVASRNKDDCDGAADPLDVGRTNDRVDAHAAVVASDGSTAAALATRESYEARWQQLVSRSRSVSNTSGAPSGFVVNNLVHQSLSVGGGGLTSSAPATAAVVETPQSPAEESMVSTLPGTSHISSFFRQIENENASAAAAASQSAVGFVGLPVEAMEHSSNAGEEPTTEEKRAPLKEPRFRQRASLDILKCLCEHSFMTSYLLELLTGRDALGHTPFMAAVANRAYGAALLLWDTAQRLACATSQYRESLMAMIFPSVQSDCSTRFSDSRPDDSPLFVLCYNDTCSFTWTGDDHINQDIFECKTCGLVGSLCCCTECAYVCHKNHDCKLKRTSPTAYCDCWEKCSCKALVAGNQNARFDLLNRLLANTDLVNKTNGRGEHLLLFLVRTVGRQIAEQRQYHRPTRSKNKHQNAGVAEATDMPEHDLDPPKFGRRALERLLNDYESVRSMVCLGWRQTADNSPQADDTPVLDEAQFFLLSQSAVSSLDRFVSILLGRCSQEMLDTLLTTLIRGSQQEQRTKGLESGCSVPSFRVVIGRFVRSAVRLYAVLSVVTVWSPTTSAPVSTSATNKATTAPYSASSLNTSTGIKRLKNAQQLIHKCRRVFQALIDYAMVELVAAADATLAPCRLGFVKPTQPFQPATASVDVVELLGKLFSTEPVPGVAMELYQSSSTGGGATSLPAGAKEVSSSNSRQQRRRRDGGGTSAAAFTGRRQQQPQQRRHVRREQQSAPAADVPLLAEPEQPPAAAAAWPDSDSADSDHERPRALEPHVLLREAAEGAEETIVGESGVAEQAMDALMMAVEEGGGGSVAGPADGDYFYNSDDGEEEEEEEEEGSDVGVAAADGHQSGEEDEQDEASRLHDEDDEDEDDEDEEEDDDDDGGDDDQNDPGDDDADQANDIIDIDSGANEDDDDDEEVAEDVVRGGGAEKAENGPAGGGGDESGGSSEADDGPPNQGRQAAAASGTFVPLGLSTRRLDAETSLPTTAAAGVSSLSWVVRRSVDASFGVNSQQTSSTLASTESGANTASVGNNNNNNSAASGDAALLSTSASFTTGQTTTAPPPPAPPPLPSQDRAENFYMSAAGVPFTAGAADSLSYALQANAGGATFGLTGSSSRSSSVYLARVFNALVTQLVELLPVFSNYRMMAPSLPCVLVISKEESERVKRLVEERLEPSWHWLCTILDTFEAQLKFGSALAEATASSSSGGSSLTFSSSMATFLMSLGAQPPLAGRTATATAAAAAASLNPSTISSLSGVPWQQSATVSLNPFVHSYTTYPQSAARFVAGESFDETFASAASSSSYQQQHHHHHHHPHQSHAVGASAVGQSTTSAGLSSTTMRSMRTPTSATASGTSRRKTHQQNNDAPDAGQEYGGAASSGGCRSRDFVGYLLSLLRAQSGEHGDEYPTIDLGTFHSVAYVVDVMFKWLEACNADKVRQENINEDEILMELNEEFFVGDDLAVFESSTAQSSSTNSAATVAADKARDASLHRFFQRSKSLLYPGVSNAELHPFTLSVDESIPLARRPQLLRPDTPRERMFAAVSAGRRTAADHREQALERGNEKATSQSLVERKPTLFGQVEEEERPPPIESPPLDESPVKAGARETLRQVIDSTVMAETLLPKRPTTRSVSRQLRGQSVIVRGPAAAGDDKQSQRRFSKADLQPVLSRTELLIGRWKLALTVLSKRYSYEVGSDPNSILRQLTGFAAREARFRKEMERQRNSQTKDLQLEVDRERHLLIQQTIKQLNAHYTRRQAAAPPTSTPMAVHRVKVTFKDEPGEGRGVARSFYAAISEALLSPERLPNLEHCQPSSASLTAPAGLAGKMQQQLMNRVRMRERERQLFQRRRSNQTRRYPLSVDATPFYASAPSADSTAPAEPNWDPSKQMLGERLLPKVRTMRAGMANKITGMLLELPPHQILALSTNDESLRAHVEDAIDLLLSVPSASNQHEHQHSEPQPSAAGDGGAVEPATGAATAAKKSISTPNLQSIAGAMLGLSSGGRGAALGGLTLDPDELIDSAPLFFMPTNTGYYSPVAGKQSAERFNAFRNVGRLIGLCLLQNEVLPLPLCRHVLKFLLGRPVNWYDLAFFDADLFESLRRLVDESSPCPPASDSGGDPVAELALNFVLQLKPEEGGGTVELKPNGRNIPVTSENLVEYVYLFVECRLVKVVEKCLEAMKQGVADVVPLESLSSSFLHGAEELRLVLCGAGDVEPSVLHSYTSFSDESSSGEEQIQQFKRWFWVIVTKMTPQQRQDLVNFWTGSPALPSSEEGFRPLPSVVIRPADDQHLPTANTCISRLYVPLYSSKQIMRQKLLTAIHARNFGFV